MRSVGRQLASDRGGSGGLSFSGGESTAGAPVASGASDTRAPVARGCERRDASHACTSSPTMAPQHTSRAPSWLRVLSESRALTCQIWRRARTQRMRSIGGGVERGDGAVCKSEAEAQVGLCIVASAAPACPLARTPGRSSPSRRRRCQRLALAVGSRAPCHRSRSGKDAPPRSPSRPTAWSHAPRPCSASPEAPGGKGVTASHQRRGSRHCTKDPDHGIGSGGAGV